LWLIPLLLVLAGAAFLRAHRGHPGFLALRNRNPEPAGRWETLLGWLFVIGFSLFIWMPHLDFFVRGAAATWGGSGDEYWHLSELTSVAATGIPPMHYFFPDLPLVYYYWSLIYPAILSNLSIPLFPLARTLALHSFIQIFTFVGLGWYLLRWNFPGRLGRWIGLWSLTLAGGFDFFATLSMYKFEDWQRRVPWLESNNQVSSFPTIYMWVAQHVAGAMIFLLGILIWRNLRASLRTRLMLLAVIAAYGLGTSAFVFFSCALAGLVWMILFRRVWWNRKAIFPLAAAAGIFLVGSLQQLILSLRQSGGIIWNPLRVPAIEGLMGVAGPAYESLDKILTLIGAPVVIFWMMLIELGLPFLLYMLWAVRTGLWTRSRWQRFLAWFPLLYIVLTLILTHSGPGRNLITRGMIPAQIGIAFGAAACLSAWRRIRLSRAAKVAAGYGLATALIAQSLTPLVDWRDRTLQAVGETLDARANVELLFVTVGRPVAPIPNPLAYVLWLNENTPSDSLVVEYGPIDLGDIDANKFRLLQRVRFLTAETAAPLPALVADLEQVHTDSWEAYAQATAGERARDRVLPPMESSGVCGSSFAGPIRGGGRGVCRCVRAGHPRGHRCRSLTSRSGFRRKW
jgi:hypothetical protein